MHRKTAMVPVRWRDSRPAEPSPFAGLERKRQEPRAKRIAQSKNSWPSYYCPLPCASRLLSSNHLDGPLENFRGDADADLLGGFKVHRQIEFCRLHERKIAGFGALEDLLNIFGRAARQIR